MTDPKVILVTGVSSYWGGRLAERLLAYPEFHVIGLDAELPDEKIKGLDTVQADIRNPLLVDLLVSEEVHTVCHMMFSENMRPSEASFEANVMGTMKVFGACAEAGIRKIVYKSSTAVYGAISTNSAFLTEEQPLKGSRSYGYTRDLVEIEAFCNGFRRQAPGMVQTILRFANIVGPTVNSPMTRFLQEPLAPVLLGFDPMMQVVHEDDVLDALVHAVLHDVPGVFNVAAEGVMPLTKLTALAGKLSIPVFHPILYMGTGPLGGGRLRLSHLLPIELDYLRYPWVGDVARMREELRFTPRYTAEEALREFAGKQRVRRYLPESKALAYDEERLRDTIERRRRAKDRLRVVKLDMLMEEDEQDE